MSYNRLFMTSLNAAVLIMQKVGFVVTPGYSTMGFAVITAFEVANLMAEAPYLLPGGSLHWLFILISMMYSGRDVNKQCDQMILIIICI